MEQTRIDLQAGLNNPIDGFDEWFIGLSNTDYEHVELEGDETGTLFSNEATELRTYLRHEEIEGWRGIIGMQWTDRDFSAIGDEAFVPPSETTSFAIFAVEEKRVGDCTNITQDHILPPLLNVHFVAVQRFFFVDLHVMEIGDARELGYSR